MDFFVDDISVYTFNPMDKKENTWPFNQPFYFIINMVIEANFGGPKVDAAIFPQDFIVDYVSVYK